MRTLMPRLTRSSLHVLATAIAFASGACATGTDANAPAADAGAQRDASVQPEASASCSPASDSCPAAQHCSAASHVCVDGCRSDVGCPEAKSHCDTSANACAQCTTNAHCPDGMVCSAHACVAGCSASRPCAAATCCTGACVDLASNTDDCGACGNKCVVANGTSKCASSACGVGDCAAPFADCDKQYATGCESNLTTDVANCGKCGNACSLSHAKATCTASACAIAACDVNFGDCDGKPENGCEADLLHDHLNCGLCGKTPPEICDGIDNDCDGVADESFACVKGSASRACPTTCGTTGAQACNADCSLGTCAPPAELCNLVDDDCNGKCDDLDGCRTTVLRSYNGIEHLYSTSPTEAACCGYTVERTGAFYLYNDALAGTAPLYRCYNATVGRHLLTRDLGCESFGVREASIGNLATSATCGTVPLFRLYNGGANEHLFTIDASERASSLASGAYIDEGIVGYVWAASSGR